MSEYQARFSIGDVIHHTKFDYRGVIIDIDATFQGSEEWYHEVARSRPPRERPWYHVLVDGADHATYVAERHLELESEPSPISHPNLTDYFDTFDDGHYHRIRTLN